MVFHSWLPPFLLVGLAASGVARPLATLTPERFEASPLFMDGHPAQKREQADPEGQGSTRAIYYTFPATAGLHDGLSVALRQRDGNTTHLVVYWKQESDPGLLRTGQRRQQVHRILTALDLAGSEIKVVDALASAAAGPADTRTEVTVPAPHQVTVFRSSKHQALGFEIRNAGEQP